MEKRTCFAAAQTKARKAHPGLQEVKAQLALKVHKETKETPVKQGV